MRLHAGRLRWAMSECNVTTGLLNMARLNWRCARAEANGDHHHTIFTHRQTLVMMVWCFFFCYNNSRFLGIEHHHPASADGGKQFF